MGFMSAFAGENLPTDGDIPSQDIECVLHTSLQSQSHRSNDLFNLGQVFLFLGSSYVPMVGAAIDEHFARLLDAKPVKLWFCHPSRGSPNELGSSEYFSPRISVLRLQSSSLKTQYNFYILFSEPCFVARVGASSAASSVYGGTSRVPLAELGSSGDCGLQSSSFSIAISDLTAVMKEILGYKNDQCTSGEHHCDGSLIKYSEIWRNCGFLLLFVLLFGIITLLVMCFLNIIKKKDEWKKPHRKRQAAGPPVTRLQRRRSCQLVPSLAGAHPGRRSGSWRPVPTCPHGHAQRASVKRLIRRLCVSLTHLTLFKRGLASPHLMSLGEAGLQ
ncbi:CDR ABC transporter [Phytophthora cactorum]|nr:CDR ABC transporter [Phytophthora cactorum]